MIPFGKTLREAREAKGYTIKQISDMTHILSSTITDLENENFTRIVAPIYGRGFVKLYCEAVGLDPKPMVNEFMEILSGNRDVSIKERPVADAAAPIEPAAAPAPEPASNPPPAPDPSAVEPETAAVQVDEPAPVEAPAEDQPIDAAPPVQDVLFRQQESPHPERNDFIPPPPPKPAPAPVSVPIARPEPPAVSETPDPDTPRLSRYATPFRENTPSMRPHLQLPSIPPQIWRTALLAVGALLVLTIAALGIRALYKATSGTQDKDKETAPTPAAVEAPAKETAKAPIETTVKEPVPRTPIKVSSLYMD